MSAVTTTTGTTLAGQVLAILRIHQPELCAASIRRPSLFSSVARGDAAADSNVDLAAELDPGARIDLVRLVALELRISDRLGHARYVAH